MAQENEKDEKDVLGEEYGALAGHTPVDGLKIMMGMQSEMAAENQRLRAEATKPSPPPPKPKKAPPEPRTVDLDAIRGEDPEKAAEELNRYTSEVVGDVVKEQFAARDEIDFPAKRQQAKTAAAEMVRQRGMDFSEFESTLDTHMTEQNSVSKASQADPNMWFQAFVLAKGAQAMSGQPTNTSGTPHVERPTPSSPQNRTKAVLTPVESEVRDNFARVAGEPISDDEWAFFRDKGQGNDEPRMNIDDYEEYVLKQASKQKARR